MGKITGEVKPAEPPATEQMQRDIRHTEAEITETLHSIEAKLAPARLKREFKGKVLRGTVSAVVRLGYAIRKRPLASAAMGAAALFLARRKRRAKPHTVATTKAVLEALPAEFKKHPVRSAKRALSAGRMAVAFLSAVSAVLWGGRRGQRSLERGSRRAGRTRRAAAS